MSAPAPEMVSRRPCLLIVDDDAELRESAADGLCDAGYDPLVAVNGREALALLQGPRRPRLILLDLMMPVMDGWAFREALRKEQQIGIPILVMTASRNLASHPIEADAVLLKPFGLRQLIGQVHALVPKELGDELGESSTGVLTPRSAPRTPAPGRAPR